MAVRINELDAGLPTIPDLIVHDGAAFASSLDVARVFGKRHDDVLKRVDNLLREVPEDLRTFAEISYLDAYQRPQRAFELTRDGFALLAMGFTGAKALRFKLAYIAKFNAMEAALQDRSDADLFSLPDSGAITRQQFRDDLGRALRHYTRQQIDQTVERVIAGLGDGKNDGIPSAQKLGFVLGAALDGEIPRLLSGVKNVLRNKENWKAAGMLPSPIPTDDTTFLTATEICWQVVADGQMHPKLPSIVGGAVVQHARDHLWPQGATARRSRSHRSMPTYPLSRSKEWLAAGAADFIRTENDRLHRIAAASAQDVIQFPSPHRA